MAALLSAALVAGMPAWASATHRRPVRIDLFGDSLVGQAKPFFVPILQSTHAAELHANNYGGTAICDWLTAMRRAASRRPQAVVIEFEGNNMTPCMDHEARGTRAYFDKYRTDAARAVGDFVPGGTHVYLIGAPVTLAEWAHHQTDWMVLNGIYASLAAKDPTRITYVDAGAAVEGPHQSFVWSLPCLANEPCTGPVVDGIRHDMVRAADGVHFCPGAFGNAKGQIRRCAVYSSGAFRFASAMAAPILARYHLHPTVPVARVVVPVSRP